MKLLLWKAQMVAMKMGNGDTEHVSAEDGEDGEDGDSEQ